MPSKPFFKRFDRYSKPIGLTYKQAGTFETSAGGICSIITFFIFAAWITSEFFAVYLPPGKFTTSNGISLTQADDGSWPVYNLTIEDFTIAYRAVTTDGDALPQEEVSKYITPMWVQVYTNEHGGEHGPDETKELYYQEKPCSEVYKEGDLSPQKWGAVKRMMCPDMGNSTLSLQGGDHNQDVVADQTFFFVIDSCEHFQNITKQKDCKTQAETDAVMS